MSHTQAVGHEAQATPPPTVRAGTPRAAAQQVSLTLAAQIMTDLDTGKPMLVATTNNRIDEQTSPDQLRAEIAAARDYLTRLDALADQYEAITGPEATPCFAWCEHQPMTGGQVHESRIAELATPADMRRNDHEDTLLRIGLYANDELVDEGPHFFVSSGDDIAFLDETAADAFIDDLVALTAAARTTRARMTEGRQA